MQPDYLTDALGELNRTLPTEGMAYFPRWSTGVNPKQAHLVASVTPVLPQIPLRGSATTEP
jgi:hypothetical protein